MRLQFKDKYDILPIFVNLMQIDDVGVFHFGQNVNFFLDVFPGHAPSRSFQPFLFDEFGSILMSSMFLQHSIYRGKLPTEKKERIIIKKRRENQGSKNMRDKNRIIIIITVIDEFFR